MRALPRRAPAGNGLCDPGRAGSYLRFDTNDYSSQSPPDDA